MLVARVVVKLAEIQSGFLVCIPLFPVQISGSSSKVVSFDSDPF